MKARILYKKKHDLKVYGRYKGILCLKITFFIYRSCLNSNLIKSINLITSLTYVLKYNLCPCFFLCIKNVLITNKKERGNVVVFLKGKSLVKKM